MRIAVVRNRNREGVLFRFGQPSPETYGRRSIQGIVDALQNGGHEVEIFEGDMHLPGHLRSFIPVHPDHGTPMGIVFNLSYGMQGECRYTHVASLLEMLGVPYTGAGPLGQTLSLDKVISKTLLRQAGLPTPDFTVGNGMASDPGGIEYPLIVKPRHESTSYGLSLVHNRRELDLAVAEVVGHYRQDALIERYIPGRELSVSILGNHPPVCLPIVEVDFAGRHLRTLTREDKFHKRPDEPVKLCPAPLDPDLEMEVQRISLAAAAVCHCRDYANVDIRIDGEGRPQILEVNSMPSLGPGASFTCSGRHAGFTMTAMLCRIVDSACERTFGTPVVSQVSN